MSVGEARSFDEFRDAITIYDETTFFAADVERVWAELSVGDHEFLPGASIEWRTGPPYGVGALRFFKVGPFPLKCRYYAWDETSRYNAFYLENPPLGSREYIEEIRVSPANDGSLLWYRIALVPAPFVKPLIPFVSLCVTLLIRSWGIFFFERYVKKHY